MKLPKWLRGVDEKFYSAIVKEDIPYGFQSHVFVMRATGIWPTTNDSPWYKWLTFLTFLLQGIVFLFSMLVVILFANSIEEVIRITIIALPCTLDAIKSAIIYWQSDNIRKLFDIHERLLRSDRGNTDKLERIARINWYIHVALATLYCTTACAMAAQSFFVQPEQAFLTSTTRWPYEFAQHRAVYLIVFVYQSLSLLVIAVWGSVQDAFLMAVINVACGHLAQLGERLQSLGTQLDGDDEDDRDAMFYRDLIECCQRYEDCLKFADVLNEIASPTLFAQFSTSGLLLCLSSYLLSLIEIYDDLHNFITVLCYFCCAVAQILASCYFGSRLTAESDGITNAIYESQWMDRNEKCKRAIRILTERSMRPMTIYAGGLFELSLQTFVKICKSAYSYFNLLRTMDSN